MPRRCARCEAAGAVVVGAVTIAATPRRRGSGSRGDPGRIRNSWVTPDGRPDGKFVIAQMEVTYDLGLGKRESTGMVPLEITYTAAAQGYVNAKVMKHIDEVQIAEMNEVLQQAIAQNKQEDVQKMAAQIEKKGELMGPRAAKKTMLAKQVLTELNAGGRVSKEPRTGPGGFGTHGGRDAVDLTHSGAAAQLNNIVQHGTKQPRFCPGSRPGSTTIGGHAAMLKCPFCNFHNEDGALFCEQCKSDLASAAVPVAVAPLHVEDVPMAAVIEDQDPIPLADLEPMVAVAAKDVVAVAPPVVPVAPPRQRRLPWPRWLRFRLFPFPFQNPWRRRPRHRRALPAPAAPASDAVKLPADAKPKLVVMRGQKINAEFPIYDGLNFIGRSDEKPVDIDLEEQEPPDRVWCSRQHAVISFEEGILMLEDLNSSNGTYVNRNRVYSGQKAQLNVNDVIQIGTVHLKVKV